MTTSGAERRRTKVTIRDVARQAGVSIKTVSNVLNSTGSMRRETRDHVIEVMRALDYEPNMTARSLKTGTTRRIGLGVFDFSQPFAPYLADKVIEVAREHDYDVVIETYGPSGERFDEVMGSRARGRADGWFIFAVRGFPDRGAGLDESSPLVLAGDYLTYDRVDLVTMPNVEAITEATTRLLDAGCRSVAAVGGPAGIWQVQESLAVQEGTGPLRFKGYLQAHADRGLEVDPALVVGDIGWDYTGGARAVDELLSRGPCPDAIVCFNDALALGAMHELQIRGLRIPQDVQVTGFDNVPEGSIMTPGLTTVDPHIGEYARVGVEMLLERISGHTGPGRVHQTGYDVVVRGSSAL